MKTNKIVNIIISLIVAILLWAYVVNVLNPPTRATIKGIPVHLVNQEMLNNSKLALVGNGDFTVDIVVSGNRSDIMDVSASLFTATADLFGLGKGQNYLTPRITGPGSLTIEEIRPQRIQVFIDDLVTYEKPVEITYLNAIEGQEVTVFSQDFESVEVTGAKSDVDNVEKLVTEFDLSTLTLDSTSNVMLALEAVDPDGNIVTPVKLSHSIVRLSATMYQIKTVPLKTTVLGTPAFETKVEEIQAPDSVTIKGPSAILNTISSVEAAPISVEGATENLGRYLTLNLPDKVLLVDSESTLSIRITLSNDAKVSFDYTPEEVGISGTYADFEYRILKEKPAQPAEGEEPETAEPLPDEPLVIKGTASGSLATIKYVSSDDIAPDFDFSWITEPGEYEITLAPHQEHDTLVVTYDPATIYVIVTGSEAPPEDTSEEDGN
jgi:YbbR domain-containing protein